MRSLSFLSLFFVLGFNLITVNSYAASEAQCKAQQSANPGNGCYSKSRIQKGKCVINYQFCTQANCVRNGGEWSGSLCVAKGTGNKIQPVAASVDCGANADPNPAGSSMSASAPMTADQACKCKYSDQLFSVADADMFCPYKDDDKAVECDANSGAEFSLIAKENSNEEKPCLCPDRKTTVAYNTPCPDVQAKNNNTKIEQCSRIKELAAKVQACQTTSKAAVTSCNSEDAKSSEESNSAILAGQKVLSTLGGLAVSKKAGSGEVDTCVISTLGTQTMWGVLDSMKDGCSSDFSSCQSACEEANNELAKSKALLYECTGSLTEPDANLISEFNSIIESQKAEFEEANKQCNEKAKGQKSTLENTAERSMSSAQQAAKVCNCQNVPGATNCNNLPTLAQCKMNPGLVGCATYQNNCVANPNSPACACIMNPNGNVCKLSLNNNPNLQGMVAALGSMPSQANSSGSFGSKLSASSLNDLNALLGEEATKVASGTPETAGPGSPFAQAQNSGGGGGGSGSGGVPATEGSGEGYTEEEKKGFGNGFITGAKNLLNDLLGGRKNGSAGGGSSGLGYKTKPNPDAWRPKLRIPGSAGNEYALGSKNKNIFDIMTKRYSDQNHTFIQNP